MRKTLTSLAVAATLLGANAAWAQQAEVFKNPECGCCDGYAEYLRGHGFTVSVTPTEELAAINARAGIPEEFQGCHTMFVEGYAVSGHVPVEAVRRLIEERPALRAISLPGMPMGSPGMGGTKEEPFTIYGIGEGEPTVYAVE